MNELKCVLYADDDLDDLEMIRDTFTHFPDHQLFTFPNGQELINFLNRDHADLNICLVVLDINMPVLNGVDTLIKLKADDRYQHLPMVLYSTAGSPTDRQQAQSVQTDIVLKPASFREVRPTIERLLERCSEVPIS